jgi:hypothetical protein
VRGQAGLSALEALVAVSLVVVVLLASVQVVTRVGAQIGYARTPLAERGSRAKSVASHWLQGELDYLRSRGYGYLTKAYLEAPAPPWTRVDGGAAVEREITPGEKEPGEGALPEDFARAVVRVEVEGVECDTQTGPCWISVMRARVRLYRGQEDSTPFVEGATSVVRR